MKKISRNKDVITSSLIFATSIMICIILSLNLIFALAVGGLGYSFVALKRGYSFRNVGEYFTDGMRESMVVIQVLLLEIGRAHV